MQTRLQTKEYVHKFQLKCPSLSRLSLIHSSNTTFITIQRPDSVQPCACIYVHLQLLLQYCNQRFNSLLSTCDAMCGLLACVDGYYRPRRSPFLSVNVIWCCGHARASLALLLRDCYSLNSTIHGINYVGRHVSAAAC